MGVTGLWDILRPSGKLRSLTHVAVVDGFEGNHANLRGLRIGIDASIWFFHAAYGREGENPELRTLFFRCARLMSAPFLPLFVFDGPKRPKVKRGKRISGEKHWLVDGMKGMIEAFGFEWRMAPGEAEAELAHMNNTGIIDAILSDDVDNFLFGAKMVIRNSSINLTGNSKHATKNADGRVDGNHSTVYTSVDILAHPSVRLTRGGLILIGLLSGGDYHPAGLPRCGPGIAHGLAKCGLGDELLEATQSLSPAELPEFLTTWREALRNELRTNSRGLLGSKKPSLAKAVPDSFPDVDVLLSYTNPITSATDAGARRTHTPPRWEREPDLAKIAHVCELHFEWGLKDIIIKRFRTVLWPSIVLRALRRSVLEEDAKATAQLQSTAAREQELHQGTLGTPSKVLARHFSALAVGMDDEEDKDNNLGNLIVKIHGSRTHASTDGILEYRLEIAPAQLVRLASSELEESEDDNEEDGGTGGRKKRRGGGPPPEPDSHLRVWMPACVVRLILPDLVERYEATLEAKRAKKLKSKSKAAPRNAARTAASAKGKRKTAALTSRNTIETAPVTADADEECFDLDAISSCEESDGRTSPLPARNRSRPLPATKTRGHPLPVVHPEESHATVPNNGALPSNSIRRQAAHAQESPQHIFDVISEDDDIAGPSNTQMPPPSSPSKVLQSIDLNLSASLNLNSPSKARQPIAAPTPWFSPPRVPRPFPIAFEEEEEEESAEGDHDDPGMPRLTSQSHGHHLLQHAVPITPPSSSPPRLQRRPFPAAREEEESSDDPDTVPAELPMLHVLSPPQGQATRTSTDVSHDLVSRHRRSPVVPHRHDPSGLKRHSKYAHAHAQRSSPTKARKRSSADSTQDNSDSIYRAAETSIISISSDSDDNSGDIDDARLGPVLVAAPLPLLIARSRTAMSQQLTNATDHEVIDLT
ncbi:hypothetical protein BC827DRAFT_1360363 [Russula dissimulans]|nr:hypothetical protein BC827DRAFT_1360363 [Russula dissimulans]